MSLRRVRCATFSNGEISSFATNAMQGGDTEGWCLTNSIYYWVFVFCLVGSYWYWSLGGSKFSSGIYPASWRYWGYMPFIFIHHRCFPSTISFQSLTWHLKMAPWNGRSELGNHHFKVFHSFNLGSASFLVLSRRSLFFIACIEQNDNELLALETVREPWG